MNKKLLRIYLNIIIIFLSLISIPSYAKNQNNSFCLSPSSIFSNEFHIISGDTPQRTIESIIEMITKSNGIIDAIPFNYSKSSETISPEKDILQTEDNKILSLFKKHILSSEACPMFFVMDKENNIEKLKMWLSINFPKKDFIIVPCWDDFTRHPMTDDYDLRTMHWSNFYYLLKKVGVTKINYIGDESINKIYKGIANERDPINFGEKYSTLDLIAMHSTLNFEQEDYLIEQDKLKSISLRKELSKDLIKKIILTNNEKAIALLIFHNPKEIDEITNIINENLKHINIQTLNFILKMLPEKHSSLPILFHLYCLNCKNFDVTENLYKLKYEPKDILNKWSSEYKVEIISYLYGHDFKNWQYIFSAKENDSINKTILLALFEAIPETSASIILSLAKKDFINTSKLLESISFEHKESIEPILIAAAEINPELKPILSILENTLIPIINRINILLSINVENPFFDFESYIDKINNIFTNRNFLAFLADAKQNLNLINWLKIITMFPDIFEKFDQLSNFIPAAYIDSKQSFATSPSQQLYLEDFLSLLEKITHSNYFEEILQNKNVFSNLKYFLLMGLLLPSSEKNNFIELLEKAIDENANRTLLINTLSNGKTPNISDFIKLILLLKGTNSISHSISTFLEIPEITNYRINLLKIATIILHENFSEYSNTFEKLITNSIKFSKTKKSKKQIMKTFSTLATIMKIPQNPEMQNDINKVIENAIINFESSLKEINNKTSFPNEINSQLLLFFIEVLKKQWNMEINKNIDPDILFERLGKISSFFIYSTNWMTVEKGSTDYEELQKNIEFLKSRVIDFLNTGKEDIKEIKYGGTPQSKIQIEVMRELLLKKYKDASLVNWYIENFASDYINPVVTNEGKVFYSSHINSIEFWLNRGLYGGGNCASPNSPITYTRAVNGANFSALSNRLVLSTTQFGKEAIISETRSILKDDDDNLTPILLYEHMYKVNNLPQGTDNNDFANAALLNAMKNAALYGFDKIFLAEGTKQSSGFSNHNTNIGSNIVIEYIKDGIITKEKITISEIRKGKRNFYLLEEPVRWKYTDNVIFIINDKGSYEKMPEDFSIVDFKEAKNVIIGDKKYSAIEVQIVGTIVEIEREVISTQSITLKDQLTDMFSKKDSKIKDNIEALKELILNKTLHLVAKDRFNNEQSENINTTMTLINEITDIQIATDRYLKNVYAITERLGHHFLDVMQDGNKDFSYLKTVLIGIPRGGIPILSKLSRFLNNRNINIESKVIDMERNILGDGNYENYNTVILCDQVINTGKTIGVTIDYLLKYKNPNLKFIILSITADPNALLRLKRKYPQIENFIIGDIRQRIEEKSGIKAVLGHPGERSLPGKAFDKLLTKDSIIQIGQRNYSVEKAIAPERYFRAYKVKNTLSGKPFFLRIMVDEEEGLVAESISALAREEQFLGGLPRDAFFDREKGMLLTEFFSDYNMHNALTNILNTQANIEPFLSEIWKDIKKTLFFLKENRQLIVDIKPETIVMDLKHSNWTLTNFYSDANQGRPVTEANAVKQVGKIFDYSRKISEAKGKKVKPELEEIIAKIETLEINNFEALDFAMRRMAFSLDDEITPLQKSA